MNPAGTRHDIVVRHIDTHDAEEVATAGAMIALGLLQDPELLPEIRSNVATPQSLDRPMLHHLGLFMSDRLAGVARLDRWRGEEVAAFLGYFIIASDEGIRRQGLGGELLRVAEEQALSDGANALYVEPMPGATQFFEERQYIAQQDPTNPYLDVRVYRKPLRPEPRDLI